MMIIIFFIFEEEDLKKLNARDPEIFTKLYKEYGKRIYNFLLIKTNGDEETAKELSSETFYSVLSSAPKLKKIGKIQTWIFQIANRRFIDSLRKKYKEKEYLEKQTTDGFSEDRVLEKLQLKEKVLMINTAMEKLDEHYREVLKLKYTDNKSQKEIAELINKSVVAVESLLFKARRKLKKELNKLKGAF